LEVEPENTLTVVANWCWLIKSSELYLKQGQDLRMRRTWPSRDYRQLLRSTSYPPRTKFIKRHPRRTSRSPTVSPILWLHTGVQITFWSRGG